MNSGDVISYIEMCQNEGVNLQRGMNFRLKGHRTVILMSVRVGAPYTDRVEDNGNTLIYEGHDAPNTRGGSNPKLIDQPAYSPGGRPTQNMLFYRAAELFKQGKQEAELVVVYEKIKAGIWVYAGIFHLADAWCEPNNSRQVYKFKLKLIQDGVRKESNIHEADLDHNRMIPTAVKLEVWRRDGRRCQQCGSVDNLHFDHIIPYSKGGSSLVAENIQLLCARHNLQKRDRIC